MQENLSTEVPLPTNHRFINHTGRVYGRLTVLRYIGSLKRRSRWECQCECGNVISVVAQSLLIGQTKSCGCYRREVTIERETTHGYSKTAIYNIWAGIVGRCTNPNNDAYDRYGGRGITVCVGWRSFENFHSDMGERPSKQSIDRINNNGGYWCGHCDDCTSQGHPPNCRWATSKEQGNNRRKLRLLTYKNETLTMTHWAERTGLSVLTIFKRLERGWSIEKTLSTPLLFNRTVIATPNP